MNKKTIKGVTFQIPAKLNVADGIDVATLLGKRLFPALGHFLDGVAALTAQKVIQDTFNLPGDAHVQAPGGVSKGIQALADALDAAEIKYLVRMFANGCQVQILENGKINTPYVSEKMDEIFAGKPGLLIEWLYWCIGVNFEDFSESFLGPALALLGSIAKGPQEDSSTSPIGSTITDIKSTK